MALAPAEWCPSQLTEATNEKGEWAAHAKHDGVIIMSGSVGGAEMQPNATQKKKSPCEERFSCRPAERSAGPYSRMMPYLFILKEQFTPKITPFSKQLKSMGQIKK